MKNIESLGARVRAARKAKNLTQIQLSALVRRRGGDLSQSQLSAIEKDEVERPGSLVELAAVLDLTPEALLGLPVEPAKRHAETERVVPIAHYVGAGDRVYLIDGDGAALDYTPAPPDFRRDEGSAVQVRGDSMRPLYEEGDLLFFRHRRDPPKSPQELPERPVIVQVEDGPLFVKRLLPGTRRGRFHLLSINPLTPVLQDQLVESFAYIEWVKPRIS